MRIQVSIDRFEGKKDEFAVLVTEEGEQINFPRRLLPRGAKEGEILTLELERDLTRVRFEKPCHKSES